MSGFKRSYLRKIRASLWNDFSDNYDTELFGPEPKRKKDWRDLGRNLTRFLGLRLDYVRHHLLHLSRLYDLLADEESRRILVEIFAFKALGHRRVKMSFNKPEYLENLRRVAKLNEKDDRIDLGYKNLKLKRMNLTTIGYPMEIYLGVGGVVTEFMEEQYRCRSRQGAVGCESGDFVLDLGGCWGNTALYFAHHCGPAGRVFSFEFIEENLRIFNANLSLNAKLAERIRIVRSPVWSKSGEVVRAEAMGPGTSIAPDRAGQAGSSYSTTAIDDFVVSEGLPKVDFLKMDIEGAELEALKGAEQTIRKWRPKMAVAVYHRIRDFWEIPDWIEKLGLGYKFYLRHFTVHEYETILFAQPKS